jgi:serine/threonine protein kinase
MSISSGTKLGPYEIVAPIGAGGMGEVYKARDSRLGRDVAIKVLPEEFAADKERLARFEQEARAASALSHPNILTVFDIGVASGQSYIAMELVDGKSLRELLDGEPLSLRKGLDISVQIAEGLAKAHGAGIVHRDLKPENVMISKDGFAKILDFGLAKLSEPSRDGVSHLETAAPATTPGSVMGTVGYMSPEQASGKNADYRSDQFSFGAIGYEMATGKKAFGRNTSAESLTAIIREEPETISSINPKVPAPVRWIIERCLSKDPEDRFASTKDLARDLKSIRDHLSEATSAAAVAGKPPRSKRRLSLGAAVAATAAVIASAFLSNRMTLKSHPAAAAPIFHRLTFGRGTIWGARFAPDGGTIVYGAAWNGEPSRLFTVRADNLLSARLDLPPAIFFAMSQQSELAIGRSPIFYTSLTYLGTLARAPLSGGSPRDLEERVGFADWSPDGKGLAVARDIGGRFGLFYPEDHLIYASQGWISHPRFSPSGESIAFLDHPPSGDNGSVMLASADGKRIKALSTGFATVQGLAWRADGKEIWFTGTRSGISRSLEAITPSGAERTVCRVPATLTLYDLLRDGRAVVAEEDYRSSTFGRSPEESSERDLSALDWSLPRDISRDGRLVVFDDTGEGGGDNGAVYIRKTDGSPPVLLGSGAAGGISPDGAWIAGQNLEATAMTLLPTGPGKARTIPLPLSIGTTFFLSDGKRVFFRGVEKGHSARLYVMEIATGSVRPFSEEGIPDISYMATSPDGRSVVAVNPERRPTIYAVDGSAPKPVSGGQPGDYPAGWSGDGHTFYFFRRGEVPCRVFRVDLATGKRELWKEIVPPDSAGVTGIGSLTVSADGKGYAYGATRILSTLYLVEGLK